MDSIQSSLVYGQESWKLKSKYVAAYLTKRGGHLAPVYFDFSNEEDYPKKIQPYFINNWNSAGETDSDPLLQILRGDFFCLPFGNVNLLNGESHPNHGETATEKWSVGRNEERGDYSIYNFHLKTKVRKGSVTKCLGYHKGHHALYSQDIVEGFEGPSSYGHHATLRMPDRYKDVFVSTSEYKFGVTNYRDSEYSSSGDEYFSLESGTVFSDIRKVPTVWKKLQYVDCTVFPAREGFGDILALFHQQKKNIAWTCAVFQNDGYMWFCLKDPEKLPGLLFWIENKSRKNAPWNGEVNCLGLIDMCGNLASGLGPSVRSNWLNDFGIKTYTNFGKEPFTLNYIQGVAPIPANFGRVVEVVFGNIDCTFISETGLKITREIDHRFIENGFPDE